MSELKVDSERVKRAAETCPDAARVLKELFPDVFKPTGPAMLEAPKDQRLVDPRYGTLIESRSYGSLKGQFYLTTDLSWTIEKDDFGYNVLVARVKEK